MTTIHSVDLLTRDGERLRFDCAEGENLVAAAAKSNLTLPSVCCQGGCGACRATAENGDYVLGEHSPAALPAEAAAAGGILLCSTFPRGNLTIRAPFDSAQVVNAVERRAEIAEIAPVGERTLRLLLSLVPDDDGGSSAEFEPGQYMELQIPGTDVKRAYSLANTGNWSGHLEFLIRLQPQGKFSTWLESQARPGQILTLRGPSGGFALQENGLTPRWFVGGGTGLAPLLSMLRRMAEWQDPQPARLYFGVTRESELFALDEIDRLKADLPQLQVTLCVWQPGSEWTGFAGSPIDALRRDLPGAKTAPDLYLCGPPALIDAAEQVTRDLGLSKDRVFSEKFLPGVGHVPSSGAAAFAWG